MKPIRCIFGKHGYKPSEMEVYLVEKKNGMATYRSIAHCCYCGKETETLFTVPFPWEKNDE